MTTLIGWFIVFTLAVAAGNILSSPLTHDSPHTIILDPSDQCQEDEAWWWIANDTRGCVNTEDIR